MKTIKAIALALLSILVQIIFIIPRGIMILFQLIEFILRLFRNTLGFAISETEKEIINLNQSNHGQKN